MSPIQDRFIKREGNIIQSPESCTMPPVPTSFSIQSSAQEDKQNAPRQHGQGGVTAQNVNINHYYLMRTTKKEYFSLVDRATKPPHDKAD